MAVAMTDLSSMVIKPMNPRVGLDTSFSTYAECQNQTLFIEFNYWELDKVSVFMVPGNVPEGGYRLTEDRYQVIELGEFRAPDDAVIH